MRERFRIAIVGSGAVGCYYGGRLAQAGFDVCFLMRGDLGYVRENGLEIRSVDGDFVLPKVSCQGDTASMGPCDLVIIALKTTDNDLLPELLPPLLHGETRMLTLQNGLGNEEFLARHFGAERILGAVCFVCINRTAPGIIEHLGEGEIRMGRYLGGPDADTRRVHDLFVRSGIRCTLSEDLDRERWWKLVWNIPFNGLGIAAGGIDVATILADPGLEALARDLMGEVIAAARASGHNLPDDLVERQMALTAGMGAYHPSSVLDHLAGRPVEVESIWGKAFQQGRAAGAEVVRLEMLYHLLRRFDASGRRHET